MGKFTREFEIVLNYLGWGDPEPTILTIGVEEKETWCSKETNIHEVKQKIRKNFSKRIIQSKGPHVFSIAHPIAKILSSLRSDYKNDDWRFYRDNILWTKGSKVANINLFPLGKDRLKAKLPCCYKELFGIGQNDIKEYETLVRKIRYKKIVEFRNSTNIKAIICYGKSYWKEFESLLEVNKGIDINSNIRIYEDERIILTRHFSNGFSDSLALAISNILKEWKIKLP